jgi:hypothetical protein
MKTLFAASLLLASSATFAQVVAWPYAEEEGIHWIDGKTVNITYSHAGAPSTVSQAMATQVLADVEARLNGLGLPGLHVQIGRRDITTACDYRERNSVHICWEVRQGRRADSINTGYTDGSEFWREGIIILGNQEDWTDPTRPLYQQVQHYLLHILGFAHPEREPERAISVINNNANDLTQIDIDGLRAMYGGGRCALQYNANGTVNIPFVSYQGGAYTARLQHDGGSGLAIVPGSLGRYGNGGFNVPGPIPTSPCHGLAIDGNNQLHIPAVWINGLSHWATLRMENGAFRVIASGRN